MSLNTQFSKEKRLEFKERENREQIFTILGTVSAGIIVLVFVVAKLIN
ncbi:hypothetical protein [Desulfosporosinus meridiei]|uniref:Uncharacterized protein n=1 Tax=Desulfosporosinus meridiei (strain ATCC BAA-275 / DSM 13257 / KCTC 12902 / NCIMB 13706 / S10) TaxID=768704 RepID=J7IRA9_DESMD|nr:hypothetical protein [Desulfosporosinus meridiei]AFQ44185.1 hypothetical protein Desmer_2249 [Desulfosporosinus meridiei DSM 13257]